MKVEITAVEAGIIIGLMDTYKKSHPFNKQEIKICDGIFLKIYRSVYDSSKCRGPHLLEEECSECYGRGYNFIGDYVLECGCTEVNDYDSCI